MTRAQWIQVTCHCPAAAVDQVSDFLMELSGRGVCTDNRNVDTFTTDGLDTLAVTGVTAYFADDGTTPEVVARIGAFLDELATANPGWHFPPPATDVIRDEEWAHTWKENFKPFRVGRRLVVKPTWEEYAASGDDIILEIDPGMAFGTGSHATTKLCLEAIEGICLGTAPFTDRGPDMPGSCLDVGTGSGILGIGAIRLGLATATGIDIDPEAVTVARENAALNGVAGQFSLAATPLAQVSGTFDIVVANILAEELVRLAALLVERTTPGGYLILSGILTEKEALVDAGFSLFGLTPLPPAREGEWSCLVYRRIR